MSDFIPYDQLHDGMNTDELCEVWFTFVSAHGLEQEADECGEDAATLRQYITNWQDAYGVEAWQDPLITWLDRYVIAWGKACDVEWRMGHGIEPHHGWTQPTK